MTAEFELTEFSSYKCQLGEAPYWHGDNASFYWLDIEQSLLLTKRFDSSAADYDQLWQLPYTPSKIIRDSADITCLYLVSDIGLMHFNLKTGESACVTPFSLAADTRTNDAGVDPWGQLWFGTMSRSNPDSSNGAVYIIPSSQNISRVTECGIPNTFAFSVAQGLFIFSDSSLHKTYKLKLNAQTVDMTTRETMLDFSHEGIEPDGGCFDRDSNLWLAQWSGGRVSCYDLAGNELARIEVPVSNPSACCFGGLANNHLLITTAAGGNSTDQGKCFLVRTSTAGIAPFPL